MKIKLDIKQIGTTLYEVNGNLFQASTQLKAIKAYLEKFGSGEKVYA